MIYSTILDSICLGVKELTTNHTADHIKSDLSDMLLSWAINLDKVTAITTDNGANIIAAVRLLCQNENHVPCFAHTLNLVVTKALEVATKL